MGDATVNIELVSFQLISYHLTNCPQVNATNMTRPHWGLTDIGAGNGLVPSGNKPLPEPMLTKISDAIWILLDKMS